MGATEAIATFIANTSTRDFPPDSGEKAKKAIADTFAAIVAGADSEVAEPLHRYLGAAQSSGAVPILGTGITAAPETAALVNGAFGAALDYDDVLSMMPAHPSAVIVPAMLASLDGRRVHGRSFIEAYILGVEVGAKIGLGITTGHYHRGFHATGTLTLFSAIAALAKLHRLEIPEIRLAVGIAASMASGLRRNFGTMTKPLHSGLAARSAVTAWRLATSGFTAAPDVLEAPAGFFSTYGVPESDTNITVNGLGRPFVIVDPGLALKKFPCCYATHRAMDGLLALRAKLACNAGSIDRVVCKMPPGGMQVLTYARPATGLEAKFSLQYCLAAGVLDGKYSLWTFTDAAVRRPEIASLYERIDVTEDPACRGSDPHFEKRSSGSRGLVEVEVRLRDGRSERTQVERAPGSPARELSWNDLRAKFIDCVRQSQRVSEDAANGAFETIRNLEQIEDVTQVTDLLS
jgi:2-methylcitrate dehydratase PrpD